MLYNNQIYGWLCLSQQQLPYAALGTGSAALQQTTELRNSRSSAKMSFCFQQKILK